MGKRIAVTGGIGAGKSTVLALIKELGYSVFSCDEIYKEMINEPLYVSEIEQEFPGVVSAGKIDRAKLAEIVFSDPNARIRLNAIAHPMIMHRLSEQMSEVNNDLVFAEVPLLFEGNYQSYFSDVIVVVRGQQERIGAVCERDHISQTEALARLHAQYDYDDPKNVSQWKEQGIHVLENVKDINRLKENLKMLIKSLKN